MSAIQQLLTEHIDIWTAADTEKKSGRGRSSANAASVYGIRKLRELILELAVRGKLVPQDANDEPASELLKRIQAEKVKLIEEGKIRSGQLLAEITEDEKPFVLPRGWDWVRLGHVSEIERGGSPRPIKSFITNEPDGLNWIKIGDTDQGGKYITSTDEKIRKEGLSKTRMVYPGDFLLTNSMSFGRPYITKIEGCIHDGWLRISPPRTLDKDFLYSLLSSPYVRKKFIASAAGAVVQNLNAEKVRDLLISVPPLAEQLRIVAKVDELMALCDQLENQHSNAAEAHKKLVSHLIGTLTQSQSAEDFSANWQRIAAHFDTLFTTEASIDDLKQTILQLAVMGKLVSQDPNDEPANELLRRIQAEKTRLIVEGKIKKDKPLPPIGDDDKPFDLPVSWAWVRLGDLVEMSGAGWSPNCEGHPRIENDWGVLKVSAVSWGKFLPNENKALPKSLDARLDCVVETGDFLVSRANTAELVARSVVVEDCPPNLMLSDKIVRLRLSLCCDKRFINIANSSSFARSYYSLVAGGTSSSMKNVTREQILNLIVGKPPLAEQHRIVAKVVELMTLCDQLKIRITQANQLQQKLANVVVEQAML